MVSAVEQDGFFTRKLAGGDAHKISRLDIRDVDVLVIVLSQPLLNGIDFNLTHLGRATQPEEVSHRSRESKNLISAMVFDLNEEV